MPEPTDITDELWRAAGGLDHRLPVGHLPVRLVGMGVSGMDDTGLAQGMLFDGEKRQKQSHLKAVTDQIRGRSTGGLRRGSSLPGESPRTL